jgi:TusA-related sulfurtransferase
MGSGLYGTSLYDSNDIIQITKDLKAVLIKQHIDALGLTCPEPLLMTRVALNKIDINECVEVLTSDVSSVNDFHRLIELTNHKMMLFEEVNNSVTHKSINTEIEVYYRFVLKKGQ